MATTALVKLTVTITGQPEGGSDFQSFEISNTAAVNSILVSTATTALGTATPISIPSSGKLLVVLPNSTNTLPLRLTGSTSDIGIAISSRGPQLLTVQGGTTVHLYTTGTTSVPFRAFIF